MAVFVINEWLWADLSGGNGPQHQREAFNVIDKLPQSEHQIVVIEGSPFDHKAWNLCKSLSTNPIPIQRIAGAYVANLRQNSDRCLLLRMHTLPAVPQQLASATKADDHYLIQAQLTVAGAILVTTDGDLCDAVTQAGLPCISREKFLSTYL
jgi:hypothetical protein